MSYHYFIVIIYNQKYKIILLNDDITTKLAGKANTSHSHSWSSITSKPSTFTPSAHTHDGTYYTEAETKSILSKLISGTPYIQGVTNSSPSVSVPANGAAVTTVTFTVPSGYYKTPVIFNVNTTGWAGIICQGIQKSDNVAALTLYNCTSTARTVAISLTAYFQIGDYTILL